MLAALIRAARPILAGAAVALGVSLLNQLASEAEERRDVADEATQALAAHAEELRRVIAGRHLELQRLDAGINAEDQAL